MVSRKRFCVLFHSHPSMVGGGGRRRRHSSSSSSDDSYRRSRRDRQASAAFPGPYSLRTLQTSLSHARMLRGAQAARRSPRRDEPAVREANARQQRQLTRAPATQREPPSHSADAGASTPSAAPSTNAPSGSTPSASVSTQSGFSEPSERPSGSGTASQPSTDADAGNRGTRGTGQGA